MSGFGALAELPWERVTDKIERRVLAGQQGMIVWWKMKAGAHLRGEDSSGLIARLRKESVPVIMLSGSFEFPAPVSPEGVTMVEKPISEAQILQYLKPILKAGR
jgi:hypothetical protein